jgi:hypothetical protein
MDILPATALHCTGEKMITFKDKNKHEVRISLVGPHTTQKYTGKNYPSREKKLIILHILQFLFCKKICIRCKKKGA